MAGSTVGGAPFDPSLLAAGSTEPTMFDEPVPTTQATPTPATAPRSAEPAPAPATRAEPEPEPRPEPVPEPPKHPRLLVRTALALGFTQQQIDSTPTEQLEEVVHDYNMQVLANARLMAVQQATQRQVAAVIPAPEPEPEPEEEVDLGIDESKWDPEYLKDLKTIAKKVTAKSRTETKELKERLQKAEAREQQRSADEMYAAVDRSFAKHSDFFGVGSRASIRTDSEEYSRRIAALAIVDQLTAAGVPGTFEQKLDRARTILSPARTSTPEPEPEPEPEPTPRPTPPRDIAGRWATPTARPTSRDGAQEPKGEARAAKALRQYFREHDNAQDIENAEILNGIPK